MNDKMSGNQKKKVKKRRNLFKDNFFVATSGSQKNL